MKFAAAVVLLLALASVANARPVGLRSLLSDEKDTIYCTGPHDHHDDHHRDDECPEHFECAALKHKVCRDVPDCTKDAYGKEKCTYKKECYEYACVEIPKYCEVPYGHHHEDECEKKYGKDLECKKLDKKVCVNEKGDCKYVDTHECKEYDYEHKCHFVDSEKCLIWNKEHKCEEKQECKEFKTERKCKPGKKYGEEDCEYVQTHECKEYEYVKGHCKSVNTTCKKFKQEKKCDKVKKCIEYKQEEVCEDKKVCWDGECVEVHKKKGHYFG